MAKKMEYNQISHELREKQLKLKSDYSDYSSVNSPIIVECINGHEIHTTLKTVRLKNFTCSQCVGTATKGKHVFTTVVPQKTGYRVIGFDNASHNMGVAIFDNGKLVYYNLLTFNQGTAIQRLNKIRDTLENQILPLWEPDIIQIEDIQHQTSYATYEVLVKLKGVFEMACDRFGIELKRTRSSTWRSHFAINHRKREDDKKAAIQTIKDMYNIDTTDDVAEAILIAKYRSDLLNKGKVEDLF